jgi:acyl-coenzyme A synthetase/AMP-(fatty) acid ligase
VNFVDELPRNATGKLLRRVLVAEAAGVAGGGDGSVAS